MDQMIKRLRSFNLSRKFIFTIIYRCIKELSAHSLRIEVSLRDLRKAQRKFEWSGKRSIRETKNNSRRLHGRLISDHPRWNLPASFSVIKGSFPPKKAGNVAVSIDRRNRFEGRKRDLEDSQGNLTDRGAPCINRADGVDGCPCERSMGDFYRGKFVSTPIPFLGADVGRNVVCRVVGTALTELHDNRARGHG